MLKAAIIVANFDILVKNYPILICDPSTKKLNAGQFPKAKIQRLKLIQTMVKFHNRTEAGMMLAQSLRAYANHKDLLVLALPRGGVPVSFEVAKAFNAPLDVCIVRKLGVPNNQELAMGAIASRGIGVLNYDVINTLGITKEVINKVASEELAELKRRDRKYRGDAAPISIKNKTVILIDDGIATGSTIRAAITLIKQQQPVKLIVAVPVAPASTCEDLKLEVDEIVCLQTPVLMSAIGLWYEDFSQTTDEEVSELLKQGTGNREQGTGKTNN